MPHSILRQEFEKPFAEETFILNLKDLNSKSTLIFGTAYDIPTSQSILSLMAITLPKETRSKKI
jgi:hypothetical protein